MEGNAQRFRVEHLEAANWQSFVRDRLETSTDMVAKLVIDVSYFAHLDTWGIKGDKLLGMPEYNFVKNRRNDFGMFDESKENK
jgi:hypothetical protein